jgi:1,4-dihydroxy-2-naphthoate octaprenyltransferase
MNAKRAFAAWLLAARPKTLPAAAATALAGSAVAYAQGAFRLGPALAALLTALLLQIGANLANDVYDYYRGADQGERLGPTRVTQAGLLTPRQVLAGMWLVFALAALLGVYLIAQAGWPALLIGALAILSAIAYTGGPFPLAYNALGDVFVFLFFGLASVCGTYYVQARTLTPAALWAAVPMGLLTVNILVVNNLRDIAADARVGKKTLAVLWGARGARREFLCCLAGAYLALPLMWLAGAADGWVMLAWLSLPAAASLNRAVWRQEGRALNRVLAQAGRLELLFGLLFSLGLILGA